MGVSIWLPQFPQALKWYSLKGKGKKAKKEGALHSGTLSIGAALSSLKHNAFRRTLNSPLCATLPRQPPGSPVWINSTVTAYPPSPCRKSSYSPLSLLCQNRQSLYPSCFKTVVIRMVKWSGVTESNGKIESF